MTFEEEKNDSRGTHEPDDRPSGPNKPATPELTEEDKKRIREKAEAFAESFKTGEWFENIRIDAGIYVGEYAALHERASMQAKDTRIKELEEAQRWREIATDGLPGEEGDEETKFLFITGASNSASRVYTRADVHTVNYNWLTKVFTHYIELPINKQP